MESGVDRRSLAVTRNGMLIDTTCCSLTVVSVSRRVDSDGASVVRLSMRVSAKYAANVSCVQVQAHKLAA